MDTMTREQIDLADHKGATLFFSTLKMFYGDSMRDWDALDMFARDGILTVARYSRFVKNLDLWELNEEHDEALEKHRPRQVVIGDSYVTMEKCKQQYDFIVIDTPQGTYKDSRGILRTEHFDVVRGLGHLMKDRCVVVVYVNKVPYNKATEGHFGRDEYDDFSFETWMKNRQQFYGNPVVTETTALRVYAEVFGGQGFDVKHAIMTPCYEGAPGLPPSFRLAMDLVRNN